ncbi:hypothetical protein BBJ28_00015532 [Nothophytophthora sp. Chile5]|nr:hypothetical protein BBJ28_00015532 [Nothophytophthora sp. Chile5]
MALVQASPLEYDPITPVEINVPLTSSHPAYGAKVDDDCVQPIVPTDPNQAIAESMTIENVTSYRRLRTMEDASNADINDLDTYFGESMEVDFTTLQTQYKSGTAPSTPWASSYWPTYQDGINHVWKSGEACPSEKYATAYGLDVTQFKDKVSANNGIDSRKSGTACTADANCKSRNDGSVCAKRAGKSSGFCVPTWYGICHAWAPAAILEEEPQCDVKKNGVTFHVMDIKGLLTDLYDGASIATVFTGARFNGPDSPATVDQYGRYTNAARRDLGAGFFHIAVANIMGKQKQSFVVDVTPGAEVWNQPVRSFNVKTMELVDVATASMQYFGTSTYPFNDQMVYLAYVKTTLSWIVEAYADGPLVSTGKVDAYTTSDDYEYVLELDANYAIIGGEWVGGSMTDHPDFLWFPTGKPAASAVTSAGMSYANVQELLKMSVACSSSTTAPTPTPTSTQTPTPTPTSTQASTPTPTPTSTQASTPTPTQAPTSTPTESPIPTETSVPTESPSPNSSDTGSRGEETPTPTFVTSGSGSEGDNTTPTPTTPGKGKGNTTPAPTSAETTTPATTAPGKGNGNTTPAPESTETEAPQTPGGKGNTTPAPTTPEVDVTPAPTTPGSEDTPAPETPGGKGNTTPAPTTPEVDVTPAPTTPGSEDTPAPETPGGKGNTTPAPTTPEVDVTPAPTTPGSEDTPAPETPGGKGNTTPAPTTPEVDVTPAPTTPGSEDTPAPETPGGKGNTTPAPTTPEVDVTPAPTTPGSEDTPAPETPGGKGNTTPAPTTPEVDVTPAPTTPGSEDTPAPETPGGKGNTTPAPTTPEVDVTPAPTTYPESGKSGATPAPTNVSGDESKSSPAPTSNEHPMCV